MQILLQVTLCDSCRIQQQGKGYKAQKQRSERYRVCSPSAQHGRSKCIFSCHSAGLFKMQEKLILVLNTRNGSLPTSSIFYPSKHRGHQQLHWPRTNRMHRNLHRGRKEQFRRCSVHLFLLMIGQKTSPELVRKELPNVSRNKELNTQNLLSKHWHEIV